MHAPPALSVVAPLILLVDDSLPTLSVAKAVLLKAGYRVVGLQQGAHVQAVCEELQPSLIVLDLAMPQINGFEVIERLASHPSTSDLAILPTILHGDERGHALIAALGSPEHLTKPFAPDTLLKAVAKQLPPAESAPSATAATPDAAFAETINEPDLRGQLHTIGLPAVLQLLARQQQSGELRLHWPEHQRHATIWISHGRVHGIESAQLSPTHRIGQILRRDQLLSDADLETLLENSRDGLRFGLRAEQSLGLTHERLTRALKKQCQARLGELLGWPDGHFEFKPRDTLPEEVRQGSPELGVDGLVLEACRRLDERRAAEKLLGDTNELLEFRDHDHDPLGKEEQQLLKNLRPGQAIDEVLDERSHDVLKTAQLLERLVTAGALDRRRPGHAYRSGPA